MMIGSSEKVSLKLRQNERNALLRQVKHFKQKNAKFKGSGMGESLACSGK